MKVSTQNVLFVISVLLSIQMLYYCAQKYLQDM